MASELLALVCGLDHAYTTRHLLEETLGTKIEMGALVDSRTTFNCIAKCSPTEEKRLLIDSAVMKQAIANGDLKFLGWIPGKDNPSDGMTRDQILKDDHPLVQLLTTNKISWKEIGGMNTSNFSK